MSDFMKKFSQSPTHMYYNFTLKFEGNAKTTAVETSNTSAIDTLRQFLIEGKENVLPVLLTNLKV